MGSYDYSVQKNADKMSEYGMVPHTPRNAGIADGECDLLEIQNCVRSMEYLQRIVKSLLRQMNVHSHVFGPGEAITIDLQAELKYDDYVVLTKFMNSKSETDKYLYRIDEIMSNFIHVVDHTSSRFEFLENIIHFPAFYSLKFWLILTTTTVIGSLIVMLFVKAFTTRSVRIQLLYGFLIMFILSCVWSYSCMYEEKKAQVMAHMVQSNGLPPKDCDYQNWNIFDNTWYFVRVNFFKYKDQCSEYYENTMTDPLWKVNPMEAISQSVAYFFFTPLNYIGGKLGSFFTAFLTEAPVLMRPVMLVILFFVIFLIFYGPFRVSTPLLTFEPAWRPQVPALEEDRGPHLQAIRHERIWNEIMERPDGPIVKSVKNASTDMDGFGEYLTDEGGEDREIIRPLSRFKVKDKSDKIVISRDMEAQVPSASTSRVMLTDSSSNENSKIDVVFPPRFKSQESYCGKDALENHPQKENRESHGNADNEHFSEIKDKGKNC